MSKTITIKRNQLLELMDAYGKAATVHYSDVEGYTPEERRTAMDNVFKFTYAAGKNYNTLHALAKQTEAIQRRMQDDYKDPQLDEFNRERIKLCEEFAERDENDKPKFREYEDGRPREYMIAKALRTEFQAKVDALKEKFADAIAADAANDKATNAVLEEEVDVKLHTIDYSKLIGMHISGSYVDLISGMIENLPEFE